MALGITLGVSTVGVIDEDNVLRRAQVRYHPAGSGRPWGLFWAEYLRGLSTARPSSISPWGYPCGAPWVDPRR